MTNWISGSDRFQAVAGAALMLPQHMNFADASGQGLHMIFAANS